MIQNGTSKKLVDYWIEQRRLRMTNDYLPNISEVWDSLTIGLSDGAIVQFFT